MAKYTSDPNLIKGAATAYRNYDNAPGMYKGLEDLSEAGIKMTEKAIVDQKTEKKKLEDENKAAKKKKQKQDNDWYSIAGPTYENAGSFMEGVELKHTMGKLNDLQPRWIEAMESGSAEEKMAVNEEYNNIKSGIVDHKGFREDVTNPEFGVSDAVRNSGVDGGNDGRFQTFLTGFLKEGYKIDVKDDETYYTVTGAREHETHEEYREAMQAQRLDNSILMEDEWNKAPETSYTLKQIKEKAIMKDLIPFQKFDDLLKEKPNPNGFKKDAIVGSVGNIVPTDYKKLRAFVADKGFSGGRESIADLLRKDSKNIKKEIETILNLEAKYGDTVDLGVFDVGPGDDKGDGFLSEKEFEKFVQAVVDPYHEMWQTDEGKVDEEKWIEYTRNIAIERLTNGVRNNSYGEEEEEEVVPIDFVDTIIEEEEEEEEEATPPFE